MVVSNHFATTGLAAAPSDAVVASSSPVAAACSHVMDAAQTKCTLAGADSLQLAVPAGQQACPDSGTGVACGQSAAETPDQGVASTPSGASACAAPPGQPAPTTLAACSDTVLPPVPAAGSLGDSSSVPAVAPSVPITSLQGALPIARLELAVDNTTAMPGHPVVLTATAETSVTGTGRALEIFDLSTGTLVAQCATGGQCAVAYTAHSGVHTFEAFMAEPGTTVPAGSSILSSNRVDVSWIGVTISAKSAIVGPGQSVTVTATSTIPVDKTGWLLQIYDAPTHNRLTFCASGNTCTTTLRQPVAGWRSLVAAVSPPTAVAPTANQVVAQTDVFNVTWLSVAVYAVSNSADPGGVVHVVATANTDLAHTPWNIGIFNDHGQLVAPVCKSSICSVDVTITKTMPSFSAAIGAVPPPASGTLTQLLQKVTGPASLIDIQAQSPLVKPTIHSSQFLWGVDSCRAFTDGIYPPVVHTLGTPDFWGRYLTNTVCPGISSDEIKSAHDLHMGILPIYNDFICSNVSGYDTGQQYAASAVAAAQGLGIPHGVALTIDIEPPGDACPGAGNVDGGFIEGWYDGVVSANYVPAYYGDGGAGSDFANAYCAAVTARPDVANNSQVWTFEPSLLGAYTRGNAPDWGQAYNTHCPEHGTAWQFQIGSNNIDPDVDQDLLIPDFPLWYP